MKILSDYVKRRDTIPYKVELHVHLDGSVRPETVLEIAKERGLQDILPHTTVEELNQDIVLRKPCSLKRLLKSFHYFMPIIAGCRKALDRISYEFCEDSAEQGTRYVEVRYCPHLFSNSQAKPEFALECGDLTPREVIKTINKALQRGMKDFNIKVNTILCCMTHKSEWSQEIGHLCKEFKDQGVVGIDLAGEDFEPGTDPDECMHKQAFQEAFDNGIHRTVHAGENGPAEGVKEALDHMYAERIGHGYHVMDDHDLYQRVLNEQVHMEVCPCSSIKTRAVPEDITKHPLLRFVKDGANYSLNTDDPIVLDNSLSEDYEFAREMGLSDEDIIKGIFNAARSCFASDEDKQKLLKDLVKVYGPH